jgi:2-amino-4-hydroxy-6-hydroxymethyldihydropteridine diphosphokinase
LPELNIAALLLGTNLGDRLDHLDKASAYIEQNAGNILKKSSVYETAPWGIKEQDNFLNSAVLINTILPPKYLLDQLLSIEKKLGRERKEKWGPRIIDIDILYYNNDIVNKTDLKIPHPFLQDRRFSLVALNEISPDWEHPILKKTVSQMLIDCKDDSWVGVFA